MTATSEGPTRREFLKTTASVTGATVLLTAPLASCRSSLARREFRDVPIYDLELAEAALLIREGELSALELTRTVLQRIGAVEPRVQAFAYLYPEEEILEQARTADAEIRGGRDRGPLHGIPMSVKDIFFTNAYPTEGNSALYEGFVPDYDATVVSSLKAMGAVIVGKAATWELATGGSAPTNNPWDLRRSPGGSSAGSAAGVAASEFFFSMGTETGSSIRGPAGDCGVTGFKPTYGTISLHGVFPLAWSMDHVGPLARSALDAALVVDALGKYDPLDPRTRQVERYTLAENLRALPSRSPLSGAVVGVPEEGDLLLQVAHPEQLTAFQAAIEVIRAQGATIRPLVTPVLLPGLTAINSMYLIIRSAEVASLHRENLLLQPEKMSSAYLSRVSSGVLMPGHAYVRAQQVRRLWRERLLSMFDSVDVLIHPVNNIPGIPGEPDDRTPGEASRVRRIWSLAGFPAVAIPTGFSSLEGMPLGMQCAAAPGRDADALRVAHAFQLATDFHRRRPSL